MLGKELLLVAKTLSNEKRVSEELVIKAIEAAIATATEKKYQNSISVSVSLNPSTGNYTTTRNFTVVQEHEDFNPELEILVSDARLKDTNLVEGDTYSEDFESIEFGRIEAQTAKQVIFSKIREAERKLVVSEYAPKVNTLVNGTVKRVTREFILVDLGGMAEAVLPRSSILPHDIFRLGDKVKAVIEKVESKDKGPQIYLSRTVPEFLMELFKIEVPEIGENIIEIKGAARDPGFRAKIAVATNDGRIDPVGACVGMRGSRVQAVSGELGGERIDIILWNAEPAKFVINAMAPAEASSIVIDEDKHTMDLSFEADYLSQAIGKNGQNVRLASGLTGWELNAMSIDELAAKSSSENSVVLNKLVNELDIDEDLAGILIKEGFTTIDEVAYVPDEELLEIEDFDEDIVSALKNRANDAILKRALSNNSDAPNSLMDIKGMTEELAAKLMSNNVKTVEDFADCSILDIQDIDSTINSDDAGNMIMHARKIWE